ncbi:MAG: prepilin-type N-terminal cleavage/methylation domain-containing protein [Sulfurospirillaceae bacterium]|nr:prepilin-type N-terminal cleavage/methylation domain-containing protein [Sulfurospirillaceae bacterium]
MKKGFTLIEMIISIVILAILSAGTFVSLKHLYLRSAKSRAMSDLSFDSQVVVDQVAALMYDRIPSSVIGYNGIDNFQSIYTVDNNFTVLEWIGVASEAQKVGAYSGFIDMNASDGTTLKLISSGVSFAMLNTVMNNKFGPGFFWPDIALVFAGSFDDGAIYYSNDFNSTFGWHNNNADKILQFNFPAADGNITLQNPKPDEIFEKYYLVDSAYAVARGSDVNIAVPPCNDLNISNADINNTLFLFYNYRPWKGETFCGDRGANASPKGNVTILSQNVSGFEAGVIDGTIYFSMTMNKVIRGSENNVTISKQKAVY